MVGMGSAGMLNKRVWPLSRYGSHKKVENLSDDKLSDGAKQTLYRELGYFKWWVMSDEWRNISKKWWVMKKKIQTGPNPSFSYSSFYFSLMAETNQNNSQYLMQHNLQQFLYRFRFQCKIDSFNNYTIINFQQINKMTKLIYSTLGVIPYILFLKFSHMAT